MVLSGSGGGFCRKEAGAWAYFALEVLLYTNGCRCVQYRHGALGPSIRDACQRFLVLAPRGVLGHCRLSLIPGQEAPLSDLQHGFSGLTNGEWDALWK